MSEVIRQEMSSQTLKVLSAYWRTYGNTYQHEMNRVHPNITTSRPKQHRQLPVFCYHLCYINKGIAKAKTEKGTTHVRRLISYVKHLTISCSTLIELKLKTWTATNCESNSLRYSINVLSPLHKTGRVNGNKSCWYTKGAWWGNPSIP